MQRKRSGVRLGSALALLSLVLFAAQGLYAQVDTGTVLGTVKDQSGAVIPGAKVTLTNEGTGFTISKVTEADGTYVFTPVKIGTYTVEAEFQGFQKTTNKGITVNVQQQVVVDFSLQPGALTQTVEVTGAVPLLQTQNGSVGQVVNSSLVNDLPLNGRNFTFLTQLTAGVTFGQPDSRGLGSTGNFSANGTRPAQNNYLLDGIDNNIDVVDFLNGTSYVVLPSVDAIQEFKVQTNNYAAEIGRAGGAVLNATIKSGTNSFHGDVWEFLRNDALDAADFFENAGAPAGQAHKGEYRLNQFGGTIGGPIIIPHVYNGKNRTFFFGDYQGTRIRQGTPFTSTVPTNAEIASGYQNMQDLITGQTGTAPVTDLLGRTFPAGTIFDPATTRVVSCGKADPVTSLTMTCTGPVGTVRDPFYQGVLGSQTNFTSASQIALLNMLPGNRLDPNAIKLLQLYPLPTNSGLFGNFVDSPVLKETTDTFDVRVDENAGERNQIFVRWSYFNDPQFKPGPFPGIADGGAFNQGNQIATSNNGALSWTHSFNSTTVNEARLGFSGIHTGRLQPNGNTLGIPAQFGIQDIPQVPLNGGLPAFSFQGLSTLGSNAFLVSDEYNSTTQVTENLTKNYKSHTFKGGLEFQHIKFSTLQPPWSRGQFQFDGNYTYVPNQGTGNTGRAQLLLTPIASILPAGSGGVDFVGGAGISGGGTGVYASNMANTDDGRNYWGWYFQDDWKVTPKLTLNLGIRWDYFGQVYENFSAQANFIPSAPGQAQYLMPVGAKNRALSTSFTDTLAKDGIALIYSNNPGLGVSQKTNFAPRVGFAYQFTPKLVIRGGYGIFYGGFENRGYSPNIGENYPFQFQFHFNNANDTLPLGFTNANGTVCSPTAPVEIGFSCIPLDPTLVNASGLSLEGIQYNYITPYTQGANLTVQYQLTPNTTVSAGYVGTFVRHLEVFPGSNQVSQILPPGTNANNYIPFPDFARGQSYAATEGSSYYNALQMQLERRFSNGLNFLTAYTYSKGRGDAYDLLNNSGSGGYRAPYLPGFGIQGDYRLVDFDVRNIFKFSGGYDLPLGHGKKYMSGASGAEQVLLGGWSINWIVTLQDGQPLTVGCHATTQSGTGCVALLVPGQSINAGPHNVNQWMNPKAFTDPPVATAIGQTDYAPLGGAAGNVVGPGYHRWDLSFFKDFRTSETTRLQFRAEFFNILNHPNFNNPGFGGNGVVAIPGSLDFTNSNFGRIGATRDAPNDPRQIQFALKFYF